MAAKRTPFGKMGGRLRDLHPSDLLAATAKDAFKAGNVSPAIIDTANIGQVYTVSTYLPIDLANLCFICNLRLYALAKMRCRY